MWKKSLSPCDVLDGVTVVETRSAGIVLADAITGIRFARIVVHLERNVKTMPSSVSRDAVSMAVLTSIISVVQDGSKQGVDPCFL